MISQDIASAIEDFEGMSAVVAERLGTAISKTLMDLDTDLRMASPVGKTGHFRSSWDINPVSFKGRLISGSVFNPQIYAEPLEIGSAVGKRPWMSAGPDTVEMDGRIWSSQAKGGVISQIVNDEYINKMTENITNYISAGL